MQHVKIHSDQDYMTLGQLLKYIGAVSTGGQAKWFLSEYNVNVNHEPENRRGKKLYDGDHVEIENHGEFIIEK
ncbi:S4 domain protein YaaA [Scopulibacillus daqui]|uniref:S4 domain protein YaaA n=1 Tax=Scopulibacillus daqui TaxID=1469162 RepID=A0ABS2PZZ5_9BACL|nr:S4 domain-containing protein YaaA [Scopulibacillus daqui]MBM7645536.1 S4 domain protein YaaA [Scopulibacillus daqui]